MICGIDEAGRGALAGPLVLCGVVLLKDIAGLRDSKKLSEKRREELSEQILQNSIKKIVFVKNSKIDKIGLSLSIKYALEKIVESIKADRYIFDGNCSYNISTIESIIKADDTIKEVSAASILAKVYRDRYMKKIGERFPEYGFKVHKGYGTKKHIESIRAFGVSKIHRISFKINHNAHNLELEIKN